MISFRSLSKYLETLNIYMVKRTGLAAKLFSVRAVSPNEEDDETLMAKVVESDPAAFERLYEKYKRPVLSFVRARVGDGALAEELTQETFLRIYRMRASYRREARFSTWLWTIARNATVDHLRKRKELPLGADLPESPTPESEAADARLIQNAEAERVAKCVEELTQSQHEVVTLRTFGELSYEEIAETSGLSVASVKSLLHRAKAALTECLTRKNCEDR